MKIYTEIAGNIRSGEWAQRARTADVEWITLDQWTAQKSRFVARSEYGNEYAVALRRHTQLLDGDIIDASEAENRIVAVRIRLNEVMVADMGDLKDAAPEAAVRAAFELGHAIGNQHWAAVVKGEKVYVPLTVDRKVMESVMRTHRIEGVAFGFQPGAEVIPYLAPHEIRRLFGSAGSGEHAHDHCHEHSHEHVH